jgi:hypothetical protein
MKKNMSSTDGIIRILIAVVIAVLYFMHVINGTLAIILGVIAIIFIITGFINFCPIYYVFGISSRKKQQ